MSLEEDQYWMSKAVALAEKAKYAEEVPVGAIVVMDGQIIGEGHNYPIGLHDPTAHAEILAIRAAGVAVGNYRLLNATLYVTLEPCTMCAGAMVHARLHRLVYGASDPKTGAIQSMAHILDMNFLNHRVSYQGGVLAETCSALLSDFFRERR